MYVNYSGWHKDRGSFSCNIFINEQKTDYEIHYSNGKILRQSTPFDHFTGDWNHDNDVYTQYGAWFQDEGGYGQFWTPEDMVRAVADTVDPDFRPYGNHVVEIPGVTVPLPDRRPTLDDQIRLSEIRAFYQEAEKNRKMKALGIRPPGEPWAR